MGSEWNFFKGIFLRGQYKGTIIVGYFCTIANKEM